MAESILRIPSYKIKDLTGKTFSRLSVIGYVATENGAAKFLCECVCGERLTVVGSQLRRGNTRSCGCLQRDRTVDHLRERNTTHGMRFFPEYRVWEAMRRRCLVETDAGFSEYGARGIVVCDRWNDFEAFFSDMGPRPSPVHSIERTDNDGPYHPQNCIWATIERQTRNRRSNIRVEYLGRDMVLKDAAILAGVMPATAYARHRKGWPLDRVLQPV